MKTLNKTKSAFSNYTLFEGKYYPGRPVSRVNKIEPGIYTIDRDDNGNVFFEPMTVSYDSLIDLPNFVSKKVIDEINTFWKSDVRARFERRGITYKRGILLWGQHGTGKTSIIIKLMEEEVRNGGIVFFCPSPADLSEGVKIIRDIQGDTRVLAVFEEFEKLIYSYEREFLSLLDGETQIDNVVYVASTNYIKDIPPRIKDRPSRFATVIEVGLPNAETRRLYIESKTFPDENIDIDAWVKATDGMTIDKIKDLIISVLCIGVDLEDASKRISAVSSEEEAVDQDPYDKNTYDNNGLISRSMLNAMFHRKK